MQNKLRLSLGIAVLFSCGAAFSADQGLAVYDGSTLSFGGVPYGETYSITLAGNGVWQRKVMDRAPFIAPQDDAGNPLADGVYGYELRVLNENDDQLSTHFTHSGSITIQNGFFQKQVSTNTLEGQR